MELLPQLVLRQQEELIVEQVPLPLNGLKNQRKTFWLIKAFVAVLEARGWSESDLDLHLRQPRGIASFCKATFWSWFGRNLSGFPWRQRSGDLFPTSRA